MNFDNFDKAFENKIRLGLMSVLMVNEAVSFNELKDLLGTTDGNLASHIKALEKAEYIEVRKEFIDRKPNTSYLATKLGREAFEAHLETLESILKKHS